MMIAAHESGQERLLSKGTNSIRSGRSGRPWQGARMTISADASVPIEHTDRIFIGGEWVTPSSGSTITVLDSHTEQAYFTVAEAQPADIDRAVTAARDAFDHGPWPRLTHAQRAAYLRALGEEVVKRSGAIQQMWPREAGVLASIADGAAHEARHTFDYYADLAAEGR
jgi:aldehyde dehydrogenase (NAD+)